MNSPLATSGLLPATFCSTSQASLFHLLSFPYGRKAGPILLFCNYFPGTPHPPNYKSIIAITSASGFTPSLSACSQFPQKPKTFSQWPCPANNHSQQQSKTQRFLADTGSCTFLNHSIPLLLWSATDPTGDRSFLFFCGSGVASRNKNEYQCI